MLDAYLIAVDNLTINEENRLKRKVEKLEVEKSLMDQLHAEVYLYQTGNGKIQAR